MEFKKPYFGSHLSVSIFFRTLRRYAQCSDVLLGRGASHVIGSCFALIYIIRLSETHRSVSGFVYYARLDRLS